MRKTAGVFAGPRMVPGDLWAGAMRGGVGGDAQRAEGEGTGPVGEEAGGSRVWANGWAGGPPGDPARRSLPRIDLLGFFD